MKKNLHEDNKLTRRLANYALTSGALLSIGAIASGQTQYSDPQNIPVLDPLLPVPIDVDGDGTPDFAFGLALSSSYWNSFSSYNSAFVVQLGTSVYQGSWIPSGTTSLMVQALSSGAIISNSNSFTNNPVGYWNLGFVSTYSLSSAFGPFVGAGDKFMGVRFYIGSDLHYGWIRLNVASDVTQVNVVDWAYQETPDALIVAGEAGGLSFSISHNLVSRTNIETGIVTLNFAEEVVGLDVGDFTILNGTPGALVEVTPGRTYTLEVTAQGHGMVTVTLNAGAVTDLSLNPSAEATTSWFYDNRIPTLTLTEEFGPVTNQLEQTITIEFSEEVIGLEIGDFNLTNCSVANLVETSPNSAWTLDVTALDEGAVEVELPAGSIVDYGNNPNEATAVGWTVDQTNPEVVFDSGITGTTSNPDATIDISFSEPVTGLELGDFVVTNGSATQLNEVSAGEEYTLDVTASDDGEVIVELPAAAVADDAGNPNISNEVSWMVDATQPVLTLDPGVTLTNLELITVNIVANEEITGLELTDISVTNGTASNLVEVTPGLEYTVDVTATADGEVTVELVQSAVSDEAGNDNAAATAGWTYDSTPPAVTLANASGTYTNNETETVTLTFDEEVTGLTAEDFTVTNGTASGLTPVTAGLEYTVDITASGQGSVTVELPADAVNDLAGNGNEAASVSYTYDGVAPTPTLTTGLTEPTEDETVTVNADFDEEISGLEVGDFNVTNGTASNLVEVTAGTAYTVDITAVAAGEVTIELPVGAVVDIAENDNVSASVSYTYQPAGDALNSLTDMSVELFPNPADDQLNIRLDREATVRITYMSGRIAIVEEHVLDSMIDVSSLPSGIYLVHIETDEGVAVRKFIKE